MSNETVSVYEKLQRAWRQQNSLFVLVLIQIHSAFPFICGLLISPILNFAGRLSMLQLVTPVRLSLKQPTLRRWGERMNWLNSFIT